ncbi:MAG: flagellar biosynthesis protein FlhB [Firmicutes bacterium]|jgi:flagellar biosynthetic protein FlhB|nr:flagellar biosynthesis protein FlhB [Candidatus Fermentithermobacillaceae bacterium]
MITNIDMDLQLFSAEKKEPATPKRRQMAKEKGQVFSSQDLTAAISILCATFALKYSVRLSAEIIGKKATQIWAYYPASPWGIEWACKALNDVVITLILASLPVMAVALVFGMVASIFQVGFSFRTNLILPDFKRLNPLEGFKRIFSKRSLEGLAKSILKIVLVGLVGWNTLKDVWPQLAGLLVADLPQSVKIVSTSIESVLINSSILLVSIGVVDYAYEWWEFEKSIMMTRQEIIEEFKDTEGKPEVKQALRQRQRRIAMSRMMQDVPSADVVLVNPTHYAVALRYDMNKDAAPKVVAKGINQVAFRIRRVAEENDVFVVEDPTLTQSIYWAVDIGEMIPKELYEAVAQVLAYVYHVSGKLDAEGI